MALDAVDESQSRPKLARSPHSSSHLESPPSSPFPRLRAKSLHTTGTVTIDEQDPVPMPLVNDTTDEIERGTDVFEKGESTAADDINNDTSELLANDLPERFNELPIELISLTDRFIASLTAKTYSTPPSIDDLSDLYQEFYIRAASHIATHISTLASRLNRDSSPSSQSQTSKSSRKSQSSSSGSHKDGSTGDQGLGQRMLTPTEVAEKKKARKLLQYKQHALEEAIERRACESIYDKIWRHRSTIDEIRDEKLRSKTAALAVMEIGLRDLGVDISKGNEKDVLDPKEWLASAKQSLEKMNDEKFPLGKLQHLTAAHKAIVDALTNILPSSSSADEILPTLIYTLIISPPEGINIISNLLFIQRFRSSNKVDGETAYCLTNLEAAISFLENVDLASLRVDAAFTERQPPSDNAGHVGQPLDSTSQPEEHTPSSIVESSKGSISSRAPQMTASPSPSAQQRLTSLFQPPAKALGAANDIVRNTADQGFKNISNTLDNSFSFLFGRLREVQIKQEGNGSAGLTIVPKTLDDARRLVRPNPVMPDDSSTYSEDSSIKENVATASATSTAPRARLDDRLAELVGGRRQASKERPSSKNSPTTVGTDSNVAEEALSKGKSTSSTPTLSSQTPSSAFGSVRSFPNTLNPLNIPSMIRGLGRNTSEPQQAIKPIDRASLSHKRSGLLKNESIENKIDPPIKRFLEMGDASELKLGDVPELLKDYKRLAMIVNNSAQSR